MALLSGLIVAATPSMAVGAETGDREPLLGGQLWSTGSAVTVEVLPASAGFTSTLFLFDPEERQLATNRDVGTRVTVGPYGSGTELVFGIRVAGQEFRLGSGGRNPDGIPHAVVDFGADGCAVVGFEDLFGGGDRDYDDNKFKFCGGIAAEEPQEPEEPPAPDPIPAPIADAGPDQRVDEGATVTLDGSASKASTKLALQASEVQGTLPGGTSLGAKIDGLDGEAAGIRVQGSAAIGQGPAAQNTSIAYVVDVSGSAGGAGGLCGDVNSDRRANTILDCELAAALKLQEEVESAGTVDKVAVITFSSGASALDLDPTSATATLVSPTADRDGNGVTDVVQTIKRITGSGGTNFLPPVRSSCQLLATTGSPNLITAFMSDGQGSGSLKTVLPCSPTVTFHAFAVGSGSRCDSGSAVGSRLIDMATLSGGTCTDVPTPSELPDILPRVVGSKVTKISYTVDGGEPIDLSSQFALPKDGPADVDVAFDLPPGLGAGSHRVCLTVTGEDSGGSSSQTTCSDLVSVTGEVSYSWQIDSRQGPPIFLSSRNSARPTFVAPDDGTYVFELTVTDGTGGTATDQVEVRVSNLAPTLEVSHGDSFAGGVTQVNATLTDEGWLDSHSASVDWGDGTTTPVDVTTAGAGWGTFFGSHVYRTPGSFAVVVTLTDDDGGTVTQRVERLDVGEAVAVWANSISNRSLDWAGGSGTIEGRVHTNGELRLVGAGKTVKGATTYAGSLSANGGNNSFTPLPTRAGVQPFPFQPEVNEFRPGGPVAVEVGDAYHDMTSQCRAGTWHGVQAALADGVYYAGCDIQLNGSQIGGRVTVVSEGRIKISGSRPAFEPYRDGLLLLAGASGNKAIDIATSSSKFLGVLFAGSGQVDISGGANRFYCGVLGDTVSISGKSVDIRGADCGRPGQTVSGPVAVPDLTADLTVDRQRALPGDDLGYDVTLTNQGTTLVIPSLIGLENVDAATATVAGYDFIIERQDAITGRWVAVAGTGDPNLTVHVRPNPFTGVTYPTDGGVTGTTIAPGGWATWGVQGELSLTPAQVIELLDESRTNCVRTRVDFTLSPSAVQARRLYTFGTDFAPQLRELGADATDVTITKIVPDGDATSIVLNDPADPIGPGESVTNEGTYTVPVPAARATTETDAGYLSRLIALDGTELNGAAYAQASGGVGRLVAPMTRATTTRELPVVGISTVGEATVPAGTSRDYGIALSNLGSADATGIAVDASANTVTQPVTGAPTVLTPGERATAKTSYAAPAGTSGSVVLRGTATWRDPRGNTYGRSGSDLALERQLPAAISASLDDTLIGDIGGDGAVSTGDTVRYTLIIANRGGIPLAGVTGRVPVPVHATLKPGSTLTPDGGSVSPDADGIGFSLPDIAGSTSRRVVFDVVVDQPFPTGVARLEAQGTVSATGLDDTRTDDPALPGASDPTRTTITRPTPALTAALAGRLAVDADGSGGVSAGDTLAYDLTVSSVGTQQVTGIAVDVPAPNGTNVVAGSVRTSQGSVTTGSTPGDSGAGADVGTLAPFQQATVEFRLRLASPLPEGTTAIRTRGTVISDPLDPLATDDPQTIEVGDGTQIPIGGDGADPDRPVSTVSGLSPVDGARVATPTPITATLTAPASASIATWRVELEPATGGQPQVLASGTGSGPTAQISAQLDPTLLENGLYVVRIVSVTSDGARSVSSSSVVVDGGFKPGRLATSFLDHQVGLGGLPLQVIRSYDSFDTGAGDFGVGWKVDVADFRIGRAKPLGQGGWSGRSTTCGLIFCNLEYTSSTPHIVSVVWPDERQEVFDLKGVDGSTFFPGLARAKFVAHAGTDTTSTLEVAGDDSVFFSGGNLRAGAFGNEGVFDPQRFRLTDRDGTVYLIDRVTGLAKVTDRNANTLTFTGDGVSSSLGKDIAFTRDGSDRITRIASPAGSTSYAYDHGDLVTFTDLAGVVTRYEYDGAHNLTNVIGSGGVSLGRSEYDTAGRLVAWIDGEGNRTLIDTNLGANQERTTDPTGRLTTVTTYSDDGDRLREDKIADGRTFTSRWTYDAQHRVRSETDPSGRTTAVTRNTGGLILSRTDAEGRTSRFTYNEWGQPMSFTGPTGYGNQAWAYDDRGNLASWKTAAGPQLTMSYENGQVTELKRAGAVVRSWGYNSAGLLVSAADATGRKLDMTYDAAGNVTSVDDRTGTLTRYTYNELGKLTSVSGPNGSVRRWAYEHQGELSSMTDELGSTQHYVHDDAGRPVSMTDRDGKVTSYSHDAAGRILTRTTPESTLTNVYDGFGRRTTAELTGTAGVSKMIWAYNASSQVVSTRTTGAGFPEISFGYARCVCGTVESVSGPGGTTHYELNDATGLLDAVVAPDGGRFGFTYDLAGRLTAMTRPNAVADVLEWNTEGLVASRNQVAGNGTGDLVTGISYSYDAADRQVTMTDHEGGHSYGYDADGNVVSANHPDGSAVADERFTYDAAGNRMSDPDNPFGSMVYDPANRLVRDATASYAYDGEGNLVSKTVRATGAVTRYTWGAGHVLLKVVRPSGAVVRYFYDAEGRRIKTERGDGSGRVYGYDGSYVAAIWKIPAGGGAAVLDRTYVTDPSGSPLQASTVGVVGEATYPVLDLRGSVTSVLDGDNNQVAATTYSVFGSPFPDGAGDPVGLDDIYGYTGHVWEPELSQYQARARWYDPALGRFTGEDPIDALNLYPYAQNQPVNFTDPTGKVSATEYKFVGQQRVLIQMAKAAKKSRCTLSYDDALAFVELALEIGLAARGPEIHPGRSGIWSRQHHIHVGPINHIPCNGPPGV